MGAVTGIVREDRLLLAGARRQGIVSVRDLSRLQFAFAISFHIIFPAFTIGLAAWLATIEGAQIERPPKNRIEFHGRHQRTGRTDWGSCRMRAYSTRLTFGPRTPRLLTKM
jgi:hypothetical protein